MTASNSEPYVGLDVSDVAACYHVHAARIADGQERRPLCAVVVELFADGVPNVIPMGMGADPRGQLSLVAEASGALCCAIQSLNAQAGN